MKDRLIQRAEFLEGIAFPMQYAPFIDCEVEIIGDRIGELDGVVQAQRKMPRVRFDGHRFQEVAEIDICEGKARVGLPAVDPRQAHAIAIARGGQLDARRHHRPYFSASNIQPPHAALASHGIADDSSRERVRVAPTRFSDASRKSADHPPVQLMEGGNGLRRTFKDSDGEDRRVDCGIDGSSFLNLPRQTTLGLPGGSRARATTSAATVRLGRRTNAAALAIRSWRTDERSGAVVGTGA